jgi:aerobic carbon-monoxide dehydrogenase small subunit
MTDMELTATINGERRHASVEPRLTLADFLREHCALTGTHLGCEHGVCGACTVLVDGEAVRSCLMFAVQADGTEVTTIEGLVGPEGGLTEVQEAFRQCHGLQCGFCTPGFIVSVTAFVRDHPSADDKEIREALSGNLCRCTGYQGILKAVRTLCRGDAGM